MIEIYDGQEIQDTTDSSRLFPRGVIDSDIFPTVTTRTGDAQQDVILEIYECNTKENILTPTKVSTGTQHKSSFEDNLGGISRTVKTDDSLAIMEEVKIAAMRGRNPDNPSERGKSNGNYRQQEYEKGELDISRHAMTELTPREDGISNTLTSVQKDNLVCEPLFIPEATAKGYAEATDGDSVNLEQPNSKTRRGRVGKQMANTLTTSCNQGVVVSEPKAVSYTRDSKGKTQNKHLNEIVNTIHSSTGSGGNTDCFVAGPIPLNPYKDGTCRTIKAQYQQTSRANFARQDGLGATGVVQIGNIYPDTDGFKNRTSGRVYSAEGLSPTLRTVTGGHNEPKVVSEQPRYRIRKLTPRECFRLMDVDENVIDSIQAAGISNSQQYKLAGNSIVVACLEKIFEQMFFPQYTNSRTLFG